MLGHRQIGLTGNTYVHLLPEVERAAVNAARTVVARKRQRHTVLRVDGTGDP
jgi:hypothetical protein